jgi:hypothetical protein
LCSATKMARVAAAPVPTGFANASALMKRGIFMEPAVVTGSHFR